MNEELRVIISAEVSKLKKGMEAAKQQVKKLQGKFKEARKTIKEDLTKVGESATNAAKKIGAGFAAIGASLIAAAASTEEYRNQQAQLITAFETAGASAETAKETYNGLYRVLGDGGQAQEAAQHLAQLTTEEKALSEWTNICQGVYATFGASLPIESLTEAANETAKVGQVTGAFADTLNWTTLSSEQVKAAFEGNKKALNAYNKAIKRGESQEDAFNAALAKCNTEAQREELIRNTLNQLYGDAAATYEANNAQVLAQRDAQASLQEKLAAVGEAIAPVITAFTSFAADVLALVVPYITDLAETYLPKLQAILAAVGEAIGVVINWVVSNWELVSTIASVILTIVGAFTAMKVAMDAVSAVSAIFSMNPIVLAIGAVIAVITLCVIYWDEIKAAAVVAWEKIKEAWSVAAEWFSGVIDAVKAAFEPIAEWFSTLFTNAWEGIKTAWSVVSEWFSGVWASIQTPFNTTVSYFTSIFTTAWNAIKSVWSVVSVWFSGIWNNIKSVFSVVSSWFSEIFKTALDSIKSVFNPIVGFFSGVWNKIKDIFSKVGTAIATALKTTVSNAVNKVLSTAVKIINGFIGAINTAIGIINKIPGVNISKLKKLDVPAMAKGGIVDSATLAIVGERGKEAVMPLENNLEWLDKLAGMLNDRMGGNQPIVLNVDGKRFAEISVESINNLTRQRGSIPLVIA